MNIDKKLLEDQIKILALQLNKKITVKEREAFEGLLNMLGDIADGVLKTIQINERINFTFLLNSKASFLKDSEVRGILRRLEIKFTIDKHGHITIKDIKPTDIEFFIDLINWSQKKRS